MLLAEYSNAYGRAFGSTSPDGGARTLVQGTDFNCNSSICYGIGSANHALFQQLQTTLNTFAKLGITAYRGQLTVDGFLGDQTLSAARAAAAVAGLSAPSTKPQLASQAAILNGGLSAFLASINAPKPTATTTTPVATSSSAPVQTTSVSTTPTTTPGVMTVPNGVKTPPSTVQVPSTTMPSSMTPTAALTPVAPPASKTPLWVWIAAGAAGVIVVGAVGYAVLREPAPKALGSRPSLPPLPKRKYDLYWGPTGSRIATVEATSAKAAIKKTPRPYSKYKGEVYAEHVRSGW